MALAVPLSRFTSRVGGGSAFYVRPTYTIMKIFTLTWLFLTLTTAFALAVDYRLVRAQMVDGEYTERSGSLAGMVLTGKAPPTVYILIRRDGQDSVVFQQFDSKMMGAHLTLLRLRAGSLTVHYQASALIEPSPTAAQWDSLKAFCQKHDITFVNESDTN